MEAYVKILSYPAALEITGRAQVTVALEKFKFNTLRQVLDSKQTWLFIVDLTNLINPFVNIEKDRTLPTRRMNALLSKPHV